MRTSERLADEGKPPDAAGGRTRNGVLVFKRWGRPYRLRGFVCRPMALGGPGPIEPELTDCGAKWGS